jgi:hypothetical protein
VAGPEIAARRLRSQRLFDSSFKTPVEAVRWLLALQAQDYPGAKWSLGLRVPGCSAATVEQAITEQAIRRSWLLRGTLHFVTAEDLPWLLALVAPRLIAGSARRYRELELDEATLHKSNDLIADALQKSGPLERNALLGVLQQNRITTAGQRGIHMLQRASLDGLTYQGGMRANQPIFMPLEAAQTPLLGREEALAMLARRYFASRSPASLADFIWWSGVSAVEARKAMDSIRSELIEVTLDGWTGWQAIPAPLKADLSSSVYLLPGFDEYLLAYKDRSASLDDPLYKRQTPTNGMLPATILIHGKVAGTWKRILGRKSVQVVPHFFSMPPEIDRTRFEAAARRYGDYLGLPVDTAWSTIHSS